MDALRGPHPSRPRRRGARVMKDIKKFLMIWLMLAALPAAAQTVEYIHTDALGTPIAVTNASRVVVERSEYEPYGKLLNRPLTDGPGFTGHVQDAVTGLTYMQQRYYDSGIGRFLSVDPVTANSSTGANFNPYWYANNNPYKFTDPDGRIACKSMSQCYGIQTIQVNAPSRKGSGMLAQNGRIRSSAQQSTSTSSGSEPRTLNAVTVYGPEKGERGYAKWQVRWDLSRPSKLGGWVVQEVNSVSSGVYTNGQTESNNRRYWEAWQVDPGQSSANGTDTFRYRGAHPTVESVFVSWTASARFYEGLILPTSFQYDSVYLAGPMPATWDNPNLSTDGATAPVVRQFETSFP